MIEAQGDYNRAWLLGALGTQHLPAIPAVHARLQSDPPARVLDVACGAGWASIGIAEAYPNATVDGIDSDESSIALARKLPRTRRCRPGAVRREGRGRRRSRWSLHDVAIIIESVHDMSNPVEVLSGTRGSLAPGGTLIVADEKVEETFSVPGGMGERFCYASSVTLCLPAAMSGKPSAGIGAVMRPKTFRRVAAQAGFGEVRILDKVEHEALRFYRLDA
ncbi:MAG: class I SAM-dependent methyltransferase [Actinomycetota bacterium]|nr:class I SAM-dependent methyltransferase [Actinomycetota bacterium]